MRHIMRFAVCALAITLGPMGAALAQNAPQGGSEADAFSAGARAALAGQYPDAFGHWQPLADAGDRDAQYNLGNLYDRGLGVPENDLAAIDWYGRAAQQGSVEAMVNLGMVYEAGRGVSRDMAQAVDWFRRAAEAGNSLAQYKLGEILSTGDGVAQDLQEAAQWYRRAVDQDLPAAMYRLGTMMAKGAGLPQDVGGAQELYERAEEAACMIRGHEHEPLALRTARDQMFLGG